jgi:hypothetical protein
VAAPGDENPFGGDEPDWFEPPERPADASPAPGPDVAESAPQDDADPVQQDDAESAAQDDAESAAQDHADPVQQDDADPVQQDDAGPVQQDDADPVQQDDAVPEPKNDAGVSRLKTLRINFRRSQSLEADRRRLNDLVELLSGFEGEDRFEITLWASGKARYQLEFPNNTTRVCRELNAELMQRLGAGGWSVDES